MNTDISPAPFTGQGFTPPGAMTLDATNNGTSVTLTIQDPPFNPAWFTVGKEYSPVHLMNDAKEYAGQIVSCVPDPDGNPEYLPACGSEAWDSNIFFKNDPAGVYTVTVPYNEFMLAANGCAFQTDGVTREYFLEISSGNGQKKCKVIFSFTTPDVPGWNYPGQEPTTPPPADGGKPGKGPKKEHPNK